MGREGRRRRGGEREKEHQLRVSPFVPAEHMPSMVPSLLSGFPCREFALSTERLPLRRQLEHVHPLTPGPFPEGDLTLYSLCLWLSKLSATQYKASLCSLGHPSAIYCSCNPKSPMISVTLQTRRDSHPPRTGHMSANSRHSLTLLFLPVTEPSIHMRDLSGSHQLLHSTWFYLWPKSRCCVDNFFFSSYSWDLVIGLSRGSLGKCNPLTCKMFSTVGKSWTHAQTS